MTAWKTVELGEVANIERTSVQPEQIKAGTIYVGLEHIDSGGAFLDPKPVDAGVLASSKLYFTANHVLLRQAPTLFSQDCLPGLQRNLQH